MNSENMYATRKLFFKGIESFSDGCVIQQCSWLSSHFCSVSRFGKSRRSIWLKTQDKPTGAWIDIMGESKGKKKASRRPSTLN